MARHANAIPPGLLVGLGAGVASVWLASLGAWLTEADQGPWQLFQHAGLVAGSLLASAGSRELGRRLVGSRAWGAQTAALGFLLVGSVSAVGVLLAFTPSRYEALHRWVELAPYLLLAGSIAAGAGLGVAAGLRGTARAHTVAIVGLSALHSPVPFVQDLLREATTGRRILVFAAVVTAAWSCLAYLLARRAAEDAAAAPVEHASAITGLRLAGTGLWIRLGGAWLLASLAAFESRPVESFIVVASPIVGAIAMLVFAVALTRVASAPGTELPRVKLHVAAFLALWTAVEESAHALVTYGSFDTPATRGDESLLSMFEAPSLPTWPAATLISSTAAIVVLLWAIERFGKTSADDKLATAARTAKNLFVGLMCGSILLALAGDLDLRSIPMMIAGPLAVAALVVAASVCARAASTIESRPGLPTATLRSPDGPKLDAGRAD